MRQTKSLARERKLRGRGLRAALSAIIFGLIAVHRLAEAGPVDDWTFSGDGWDTTSVGLVSDLRNSSLQAVETQSTGKRVAVGYTIDGEFDVAAVRWNPDGTRDSTFATCFPANFCVAGTLTLEMGESTLFIPANDKAEDLAIDSSDRIVFVGSSNSFAFVSRLDADGALDATFAGDGIARFQISGFSTALRAVRVDAAGKIVVAGSYTDGNSNEHAFVRRYESDGTVDTTFGSFGTVTLSPPDGLGCDQVADLLLVSSSEILVVGTSKRCFANAFDRANLLLARLRSNGDLDADFSGEIGGVPIFLPGLDVDGYLVNDLFPGDEDADVESYAAAVVDGSDYVIAGSVSGPDLPSAGIVLRIDPDGAMLDWGLFVPTLHPDLLPSAGAPGFTGIDRTSTGSFVTSGSVKGGPGGNYFVLVQWDSNLDYGTDAGWPAALIPTQSNSTCAAGTNEGQLCTGDVDCPGSSCTTRSSSAADVRVLSDDRLVAVGVSVSRAAIYQALYHDCGDGVLDPGETCEAPFGGCCEDCQIRPANYVCREGSECDPEEVCDGISDQCPQDTLLPEGTACGSNADGECTNPDTCDAQGNCQANDDPLGTACGDPTDSLCTDPDSCDGQGNCDPNHEPYNPPLEVTYCGDQGIECVVPDICNNGVCVDQGFSALGSPCGEGTDNDCTDPDTCDGAGSCLDNDEPAGSSCGSATDDECTDPDTCDGDGICLPNNAADESPCGDAGDECTNADACVSGACEDRGFLPQGTAAPTLCDDADDCTADICDGAGACENPVPDADSDGIDDCTDNCVDIFNPLQHDVDDDLIGDACDNCPTTCNPDQTDSDGDICAPGTPAGLFIYCGDTNGGDVCDACPDLNQDDPSSCTSGTPCCDPNRSTAESFDALGPACSLTPGDTTMTTPDGSTSIRVPQGSVDPPSTISITGLDPNHGSPSPGREMFLKHGGGSVPIALLLEPEGSVFDPYLTLCMHWTDADNDGILDGTNLRENRMRVLTKQVPQDPGAASREICGKCNYQTDHRCREIDQVTGIPTTTILNGEDGYGNRADTYNSCVGGENQGLDCDSDADCPNGTCDTLRCCCDTDLDRYCLEVAHFSGYAGAELECAGISRAQVRLLKIDQAAGLHKLKMLGEMTLPTTPEVDPLSNGLRFFIHSATGSTILEADLPGGNFDRATKSGWKKNGKSTVFKFLDKTGTHGGVIKFILKAAPKTPGAWKFIAVGKNGTYTAGQDDLPLAVEVRVDSKYDVSGQCAEHVFTSPEGNCALAKGTVACRS